MWFAHFKDSYEDIDEDSLQEYIAVGRGKERMRTYEVLRDGEEDTEPSLTPLRMTFPGCLRFMPWIEVLTYEERTLEKIEKEYGPLPNEQRQRDRAMNIKR